MLEEKKIITTCPKCSENIEIIDMQDISYIEFCENCGYEKDLDYYFNPKTQVTELMTTEDALKVGAMSKCPKCKEMMMYQEEKAYGVCVMCHFSNNDSA